VSQNVAASAKLEFRARVSQGLIVGVVVIKRPRCRRVVPVTAWCVGGHTHTHTQSSVAEPGDVQLIRITISYHCKINIGAVDLELGRFHRSKSILIPRLHDTAGCQTGLYKRFVNRVERTATVVSCKRGLTCSCYA